MGDFFYPKLFDAVCLIVGNHGVDLLKEKRFWFTLADYYSFGADYTLKKTFKDCIDRGVVAKVASLGSDRAAVIAIIENETLGATKHGMDAGEVAVCLFSIAIATKCLSRKDYEDFVKKHQQLTSQPPQHAPHTSRQNSSAQNPPTPQRTWQSPGYQNLAAERQRLQKWFKINCIIFFVIGILAAVGSTIMYSLLCMNWSLSVILIINACVQMLFLGIVIKYSTKLMRATLLKEKEFLNSLLAPVSYAFIMNTFLSLFFLIKGFCENFSIFMSGNEFETPSLWNLFVISLCILFIISIVDGFSSQRKSLRALPFAVSSLLLIACYGVVIASPIRVQTKLNEDIKLETAKIVAENDSIMLTRQDSTAVLSFKNIYVGEPFDSAKVHLKQIAYSNAKVVEVAYTAEFKDPKLRYENLANYKSELYPSRYAELSGKLIHERVGFSKKNVELCVLERDDKVLAIVVKPENEVFENFEILARMYTRKYGTPEIDPKYPWIIKRQLGELLFGWMREPDYTFNHYMWTFTNGTIYLCPQYIIYAPNEFHTVVEKIIDTKIKKVERERRQAIYQLQHADSIRAARRSEKAEKERQAQEKAFEEI